MSKLLTPTELELMKLLWSHGPSTAREAREALGDDRAQTTVSTILRILVDKDFAHTTREGRSHRYHPSIDRREYRSRQLRHVVGSLFEGSASALVRQLVDDGQLPPDELERLSALIDDDGEAS